MASHSEANGGWGAYDVTTGDPSAMRDEYERDGCVFPVRGLFASSRASAQREACAEPESSQQLKFSLEDVERLCSALVAARPDNLAPEDLLNLHVTVPVVRELCAHPSVLAVARELLGCSAAAPLRVFTSRILCKEPETGKEIVWHQDALYWPLRRKQASAPPPPVADSPRSSGCKPHVVSIWLALDDVTSDNGPMDVLPFSVQPETKDGFVPKDFIVNSGGDVSGFSNFNLSLEASKLKGASQKRCVLLQKGEAEFHSAWTVHRSDPNRSKTQRRMAWIVRYCPEDTEIVPGVRGAFGSDYPLLLAESYDSSERRQHSSRADFERTLAKLEGTPDQALTEDERAALYAPCFGNSVNELKK
eukprot:TRINITY_DN46907_c0_g1_i1.p1 TRINITY_DN46907_c0_g1~~TRINITY_DN46907_c0_g1_i1.p1  ORF type:complete len:361 (+),score=29.02 TRINITY_DN46907_c0_g1_i1:95-1177(+)